MHQTSGEYISCDWITSGLEFKGNCIRTCCFAYLQGEKYEEQNTLIKNYSGGRINWDNIFKLKDKLKNLQKQNTPLRCCQGCIYLEKADWSEENFVDHIIFNHWSTCNCNCTYCYTNSPKHRPYEGYDVMPILKDMLAKNILRSTPRSCITFGGGEPTILKGFDKILNLLMENGFNNIRINSSGIKYSESIAKGLKKGAISLVISPDSGTKETYEKIKRVKNFDVVWNNIKKYATARPENNLVKVKYIIIPFINDNQEEIDSWFDLVIKNNVKAVSLSVEQTWYQKNYPNFPESIYKIIKYIENKAQELNLDIEIYCEAISVLKEGQKNGTNQ